MALITYDDKVSVIVNPLPDENKVTDSDMNEIKDVVNENANTLIPKDWDMSTNALPTGGNAGQLYNGFELTTRTTLTDNATPAATLPSKVLAIALQDNPTNKTHFLFLYTIS